MQDREHVVFGNAGRQCLVDAAHGDIGDGDGVLEAGNLVRRLDGGRLFDEALGANEVEPLCGERGIGDRLD